MNYRPDNSLDSANNPVMGSMPVSKDYGMHKALVLEAIYSDDDQNSTKLGKAPRVLYKVQIIGGERDGQIFSHAEDMTMFGGVSNYSERIWKGTTTLTKADLADLLLNVEPIQNLNGDVVYIQFINGDLNFPVIMGGAKHASNKAATATKTDGPRLIERFNGIKTEIDKEGLYSFTKANGRYSAVPFPDAEGNLPLVQDQFVVLPGFEEAVKVTLNNEFELKLKMNTAGTTGIDFTIDGLKDTFSVTHGTGASFVLDGLSDSLKVTTKVGTNVAVDGLSDSITLGTKVGALAKVDGASDQIDLTTTAGSALIVSGANGVLAKTATGDELSLASGTVSLKNAAGAKLEFSPAGLVKLGNNSGDVLQILGEAFQALSSQTAAGFGAPTSTVAVFAQLLVKLKLISG